MPERDATAITTPEDASGVLSNALASAVLALFAPQGDSVAATTWLSCTEPEPTFDRYDADGLRGGWKREAPTPEQAQAFAAQKALPSVGSSKTLRRVLEPLGVKFAERTFAERLGSESRPYLFISIPVLSDDGLRALAYVHTGFGEGMGMGRLVLAGLRADGVWQILEAKMVWMS